LKVEFDVQRVAAVPLRRQSRAASGRVLVALGRWIQLHTESRQPLTAAHVGQPRIALEIPEFEQVLRVEASAELLGQVGGVFGAGVEGEQASVCDASMTLAPYLDSSPSTCS
jgi:hypothetical protein